MVPLEAVERGGVIFNVKRLAELIEHLIELSPFPDIYIKYESQLIAPAGLFPKDLKKSLKPKLIKDGQ